MNRKVEVVEFDDDGLEINSIIKEKVTHENWKNTLSDLSYHVTREKGTERAFSVSGYEIYEKGIYRCICCNNALFSSDEKYNSYTGWPSFKAPIHKKNFSYLEDNKLGVSRIEVLCKLCDAHLGHVFDDGPEPTGLRFCMNSSALRFIPQLKSITVPEKAFSEKQNDNILTTIKNVIKDLTKQ